MIRPELFRWPFHLKQKPAFWVLTLKMTISQNLFSHQSLIGLDGVTLNIIIIIIVIIFFFFIFFFFYFLSTLILDGW